MTPTRGALVAIGGSAGAALRWGVGHELGWDADASLPWAVLVVNTIGSALVVLTLHLSRRHARRASLLVDGVGTGVCGGFTTFSAFALVTAKQLEAGNVAWAALSVTAVLGCGIGAAVGTRVLLERRRPHRAAP